MPSVWFPVPRSRFPVQSYDFDTCQISGVIPGIDTLRQRDGVRELEARHGAEATVNALRDGAEHVACPDGGRRQRSCRLRRRDRSGWRRTRWSRERAGRCGPSSTRPASCIHTNLGRAPLADAAIERIAAIARGYTNLEYDLADGARGSRTVHAESLLTSTDRRRSRDRRQQQRRRHAVDPVGPRGGPRGGDLPRRAGRDRRRLPRSRRDAAVGRGAARSRHHQSHADRRLHGVGLAGDRDVPARASVELPHRRLHRTAGAGRPRRGGARDRRAARRRPRQRLPRRRSRRRAVGPGVDRRRRRSGVLQRRQAARRPAVPGSSPAAAGWSIGCGRIR